MAGTWVMSVRRSALMGLRSARTPLRVRAFPRRLFASSVNMEMIKKLRSESGAPIKDCKKAIEECGDDLEAALEWMRKQGTLVRGKRANQEASQGLIGISFAENGETAALLEMSTETDSAARIDLFHNLIAGVSQSILKDDSPNSNGEGAALVMDTAALEGLSWEAADGAETASFGTVKEAVSDAVLQIRENILPRRGVRLNVPGGVVAGYVHNVLPIGLDNVKVGAIGVLVGLQGAPEGSKDAAKDLAYKIAMHIAAAKPEFLSSDFMSDEQKEAQENLLVKGRMQKFYNETCLLEQTYLIHDGTDSAPTVKKLLQTEAKKMGSSQKSLEITSFHSFRLGERS
eukprot:jgi/Bigna1/87786/estExt_fgenesh1_pg.C_240089